jgi:hypothetical protein
MGFETQVLTMGFGETCSVYCQMTNFGAVSVEPSVSATRELVS